MPQVGYRTLYKTQGARSYIKRKKEKKKFQFHLKNRHSKDVNVKNLVEPVKPFGCTKHLYITVVPLFYCVSLVTVTITRHIFINKL